MGFLSSLRRKSRNDDISVLDTRDKIAACEDTSLAATCKKVPSDVVRLLWFKDGPMKNIPEDASNGNTVSIGGLTIEIDFTGSIEPSAIGIADGIRVPLDANDIERPSYYPEFRRLTPEQRWIYLDWLRNVDSEVNIGYVFVFYYGLERHLFFGDYDEI